MNYAIVLRLLSYILYCEAALLLLPAMASLIYGEWMVLGVFLLTAALSAGGRSAPAASSPAARCSICGRALPPRRCAGCSSV